MEKILEVKNISGGYGSVQILNGIDLIISWDCSLLGLAKHMA